MTVKLKPRIMIVNPHFNLFGGAERQVVELANHLTNHNYRVTIFTTAAVPEFKANLKDARIIETGDENNLVQYVNGFSHKFDIINPHNHPTELYLAYPSKVKKVWQCNEPPSAVLEGKSLPPGEARFVKRTTAKAVVISDYDRYRFQKTYDFTPIVNYPGVRYKYFSEEVPTKNTLNMKGNFVLSQIGMFTWTKNQKKSVEILGEIKKDIPNAKLVLVGHGVDSPYGLEVQKRITELGLDDDVFINDYINGDQAIRNLYKQTSVFISPLFEQGGWIATFEAMSAGVPTIVSDRFIAANLVKENKLGWVAPIEEFAQKVLNISSDIEGEKRRTRENAKWIGENLTREKFGDNYMEIFEGVL